MSHLTLLKTQDYERYSSPGAHLYDRIGVESGVRVNGRLARLENTIGGVCLISWQTGRKTEKDRNGKPYEPMVEVPLSAVEEA